MKATKKNVAAAILEKHGHKVELIKSDGCWYFAAAEGSDWKAEPISYAYARTVYTMYLSDLDLERWVSEYEEMIEGVVVPTQDDEPKIITLTGNNF